MCQKSVNNESILVLPTTGEFTIMWGEKLGDSRVLDQIGRAFPLTLEIADAMLERAEEQLTWKDEKLLRDLLRWERADKLEIAGQLTEIEYSKCRQFCLHAPVGSHRKGWAITYVENATFLVCLRRKTDARAAMKALAFIWGRISTPDLKKSLITELCRSTIDE